GSTLLLLGALVTATTQRFPGLEIEFRHCNSVDFRRKSMARPTPPHRGPSACVSIGPLARDLAVGFKWRPRGQSQPIFPRGVDNALGFESSDLWEVPRVAPNATTDAPTVPSHHRSAAARSPSSCGYPVR